MNRLHVSLLCLLLALATTLKAQENDTKRWMGRLPDSRLVAHLSIPATHDSGATEGGAYLHTQDLTIQQQLDAGIRGFDIRLNPINNSELGVYHGEHFMHWTWDKDVFGVFVEFLRQNPTEMLFVSLKKENGDADGETFARILSGYLNNEQYQPFIVDRFADNLTLGECRGKIVFMHRDNYMKAYPGGRCNGFADNASFVCQLIASDGNIVEAQVEDEYEYESGKQADYKAKTTLRNIRKSIKAAKKHSKKKRWHLSFASATSKQFMPHEFAESVNPSLAGSLSGRKGAFGIVLFDFAGSDDGRKLTRIIIDSNR